MQRVWTMVIKWKILDCGNPVCFAYEFELSSVIYTIYSIAWEHVLGSFLEDILYNKGSSHLIILLLFQFPFKSSYVRYLRMPSNTLYRLVRLVVISNDIFSKIFLYRFCNSLLITLFFFLSISWKMVDAAHFQWVFFYF